MKRQVILHTRVKNNFFFLLVDIMCCKEITKFCNNLKYVIKYDNDNDFFFKYQTFEKIKKLQLEKYNREPDVEKKALIIIDPVTILKKAIQNCKPLLKLTPVKRGGSYYQVWSIYVYFLFHKLFVLFYF